MSRTIIFANGELSDPEAARSLLQEDDTLIAADGGVRHLLGMGLLPDIVIGDMDSIDGSTLDGLAVAGVEIEKYPEDKDETDLELALDYAIGLRPPSVLIVAALGGRFDQSLANLALLTNPELAGFDVRVDDGVEEIFFYRGQAEVPARSAGREIRGKSGDTVSLIPWGGNVAGVVTRGLRWPLRDEILFADKTRGISNEMTAETATIQAASGLLLVVHRRGSE